jgi:peroxiredoxin
MRVAVYLITLCWLSVSGFAQTHIQVILVTNRPIGRVEASDVSKRETLSVPYADTVDFSFRNKAINCYNIAYQEGDKYYRQQVWVNPGQVTVMAHLGGEVLYIDTVLNAPIYYTAKAVSDNDLRLSRTGDTAALNEFLLKAYEANIDNAFSYFPGLCYLLDNENSRPDLLKLKALKDRQGKRFEWFLFYHDFTNDLEKRLDPDRLPEGSRLVMDRNKKTYPLVSDLGKRYVLNFWFLSDATCLEEQKTIKALREQLSVKGIEVIGISTDQADQFNTWKAYLDENGYDWANFLQTGRGKLSDFYNVHRFPAYVILDEEGNVQQTYHRFSKVLKALGVDNP